MTKCALIVLGKRLNDDGSMSLILKKRLDLTKNAISIFRPDFVIVSGGIANKKAGISEAMVMKTSLINDGVEEAKIILEDTSKSTIENALYAIPLALNRGVNRIVVVTSIDHYDHNLSKIFAGAIKNNKVELIFYTKN